MTWRKMHMAGLVLLLISSAPVVVLAQTAPSAYALTVSPATPTSQDVLTLKLAGTWPDNCPPEKLKAQLKDGAIYIDMLLPGAQDGKVPTRKAIKTDWQATTTIGPLAAGTYKVYSRGVSYTQTGGYAKIGEIQVQSPAAGPVDPNSGGGKKTGGTTPKPDPNSAGSGGGPKPGATSVSSLPKSLVPGVCVVLVGTPADPKLGLVAGQSGTIIARDGPTHAGMILVSWHFFAQGVSDRVTDADGLPIAFLLKSAQWVEANKVGLALPFDERGTLAMGQGDAILLKAEGGQTFNLIGANRLNEKIGATGQFHFGDHVQVRGLLQVSGPLSDPADVHPKQDGDVHHPIITLNIPPKDKREGKFGPGDRVALMMDNPPGPNGKPMTALRVGAKGTVVYHNSAKPESPIFVSWDGFTKGMDASEFVPPPVPPCPPKSGWPVPFDQLAPTNDSRAPCPGDTLTVGTAQHEVWLRRDPQCPGGKHALTGFDWVSMPSHGETVSVMVFPYSGMGGAWKGSLSTNVLNAPGWTSIKVSVDVEGINLSNIPLGKDTSAARITVTKQP